MNKILKQIKKFHGHLGPYVVIGYKMGLISNQILGEDSFSKKAEIWTGINPPTSCIIDGIQMSSGCTLGKGNIKVNNYKIVKAVFSNNNGKKIKIFLKDDIKTEIDTRVTEENIIEFSKKIYNKKDDELFNIVR
jgi:formylmethanofuran dehydrogenase subunit E